jgi:RNA polymerase sigma-70 factor (ECF subfamily)
MAGAEAHINGKAYGRLLEPLLEQAGAYAISVLRRRHDAEDAVQQAALRGQQRLESYDASRPFKGWWFAVLRNCCRDVLRNRGTRPQVGLEAEEVGESRPHEPAWEGVAEAMHRLSPPHREILQLRYFGGLSYAELAETLEIPQGTVMSRLHLARKALAEIFTTEEQP